MSESKPLILNTTTPTEREVVLAVLAPLYPSLVQWRKRWDAAHPKQKITSRYITVATEENSRGADTLPA